MSDIDGVDLTNKHVVLSESVMAAPYRDLSWRVVLATGGFGCMPFLSGTAVFCEHVRDGEKARWERFQVERLAMPEEVAAAAALRGPVE